MKKRMKLKVLSYNIHKGFGLGNLSFTLPNIRGAIASLSPDIVFLQEVIGQHDKHAKRVELWPDLPTLTEQGLRGGVDFDMWFGLVAPAKTPAAVVAMLNQKVAQIVAEPEFRKRLSDLGGVSPTTGNSVEAFNEVIQRELAVLPKKALELGLKLD